MANRFGPSGFYRAETTRGPTRAKPAPIVIRQQGRVDRGPPFFDEPDRVRDEMRSSGARMCSLTDRTSVRDVNETDGRKGVCAIGHMHDIDAFGQVAHIERSLAQ